MPAGLPVGTPRITTGNVRTTYDPYTPSPGATTPGPTPAPFNGLACPLGSVYMDIGGADSVSGTTTQLPVGQVAIYKYVLYKSATNPAMTTCPGVVYYTDGTGLIVSGTPTDGIMGATTDGAAGDGAGYMMLNTTDLTTITAAILNNGGNGSGVWICVGGFVGAGDVASTHVAGDWVVSQTHAAGTAWIPFRLAAAAAVLAKRNLGQCITSAAQIASTGIYTANLQINMGSIAPY